MELVRAGRAMSERMPNFLVVGAPKSGTTSIYEYLKQHPEIFVHPSIKETNFFIEPKEILGSGPRFRGIDSYGSSLEKYRELFKDATLAQKAIGEVCPTYLPFYEYTIPNILKYLGAEVRIVIILRNPVQTAFSLYMHNVRNTDEKLSFEDALGAEAERIEAGLWNSFYLTKIGFYSEQVRAYLEAFPRVRVMLYEDLKSDNVFAELFDFLGVNSDIKVNPDSHYNKSGRPENMVLQSILMNNGVFSRGMRKILPPGIKHGLAKVRENLTNRNIRKEEMHPETRARLVSLFAPDIERVSGLIERDLSHWLR